LLIVTDVIVSDGDESSYDEHQLGQDVGQDDNGSVDSIEKTSDDDDSSFKEQWFATLRWIWTK
jgi:hypothetical protein